MSLIKDLYNRLHPAPPKGEPLSTPETRAEAEDALKKANTDLNDVIRKEPKVRELVGQLRDQLDRNHFGELIDMTMRGTG